MGMNANDGKKIQEDASKLYEFSVTIDKIQTEIGTIIEATRGASLDPLIKEEAAKLEILLAPYIKLATIENPFTAFDIDEQNTGLKIATGSSGHKYVALSSNTEQAKDQAKAYIDFLTQKISEDCRGEKAQEFLELLSLCAGTQKELSSFIDQLKTKYRITESHPLFGLCQKCGSGDSASFRTLQYALKLPLFAKDIYADPKNTAAIAFSQAANRANNTTMTSYMQHSIIQESMRSSANATIYQQSLQKQLSIPDSQSEIKKHIQAQIANFKPGENPDNLTLNTLMACRKYYSLDHNKIKSEKIIRALDRIITDIVESQSSRKGTFHDWSTENMDKLREISRQLSKLERGQYQPLAHRLFGVDDTLTRALRNLTRTLEKKPEIKLENPPGQKR